MIKKTSAVASAVRLYFIKGIEYLFAPADGIAPKNSGSSVDKDLIPGMPESSGQGSGITFGG